MLSAVRRFSFLLLWASVASVSFLDVELVCAHKSATVVSLTAEGRAWLEAYSDVTRGYTVSDPEGIVNPDGSYRGILVDSLDKLNRCLGTHMGLRICSTIGDAMFAAMAANLKPACLRGCS